MRPVALTRITPDIRFAEPAPLVSWISRGSPKPEPTRSMIPRLQLVELEDLPSLPAPIRNAATDYLQFMVDLGDVYAPAAPRLVELLVRTGHSRIVDFCSGGGGPWRRLLPAIVAGVATAGLEMTDRYPNPTATATIDSTGAGRVSYRIQPVDVLDQPRSVGGVRTLFSAFHHFDRPEARRLLEQAITAGDPIALFESTERSARCLLLMLLAPVLALLVTPMIRPVRASRLLLTYLPPVVPLVILWDGVVSCLRTYRVSELEALVASIPGAERYDWDIGQAKGKGPIPVTYLIGAPRRD